jgi:hypothetical protein
MNSHKVRKAGPLGQEEGKAIMTNDKEAFRAIVRSEQLPQSMVPRGCQEHHAAEFNLRAASHAG